MSRLTRRSFLGWTMLLPTAARAGAAAAADPLLVPLRDVPAVRKRALVIGAGSYRAFNPLRTPGTDAKTFARVLTEEWSFAPSSIVLMTDDAANRELTPTFMHIMDRLEEFTRRVTPADELVFFYAGHGSRMEGEDYVVPVDASRTQTRRTCHSLTQLRKELETQAPRRALLFVSACRNSGVGVGADPPGTHAPESMPAFRGMAAFLSCRAGQLSYEGRKGDFEMGAFPKFLIDALRGAPEALTKERTLTVNSLSVYLQDRVPSYVKKADYSWPQEPVTLAAFGDMVLDRR